MNNGEYLKVQVEIIAIADLVKTLPLKEFIEAGEKADTLGPFLDPTLWRAGSKNLAVIMDLARGLMGFREKAMIAALQ